MIQFIFNEISDLIQIDQIKQDSADHSRLRNLH